MWVDEHEEVSVRKLLRRRDRRQAALEANMRLGDRGNPYRRASWILLPTVAALAAVLVWFGMKLAGRALFSRNDRFRIVKLEIQGGDVLTADLIRDTIGVEEGKNLFATDTARIRDKLLRAPNVRRVCATRLLPGTLKVEVTERIPLARIEAGDEKALATDEEGVVFRLKTPMQTLPAILGLAGPAPAPRARLQGLAWNAVELLKTCARASVAPEVNVTRIDASGRIATRENALRLYVGEETVVDFWWDRKGENGVRPDDDLRERLLVLRGVLRRAKRMGCRVKTVNLTLDSYASNCPVTHWN